MTIRRAEIIVGCLCGFSVVLGTICASHYFIMSQPIDEIHVDNVTYSINTTMTSLPEVTSVRETTTAIKSSSSAYDSNYSLSNDNRQSAKENVSVVSLIIYGDPICSPNFTTFFKAYQKVYSSLFGICCIVVMILYALIYRSVLARRRKKFKVETNTCCGFWSAIPNEVDQTEITNLNNETKYEKEDNSDEAKPKAKDTQLCNKTEQQDKAVQKNGSSVVGDKDVILKPGGVSRAKLEKMRLANIKTAFMLSIVTLVFIVAFLPAWLMALEVISMNFIVFYLYFVYNVANPIIYAFMNESFRNQLKHLVCCGGSGGPVRGGPNRHSHH